MSSTGCGVATWPGPQVKSLELSLTIPARQRDTSLKQFLFNLCLPLHLHGYCLNFLILPPLQISYIINKLCFSISDDSIHSKYLSNIYYVSDPGLGFTEAM